MDVRQKRERKGIKNRLAKGKNERKRCEKQKLKGAY